MEEKIKRFLPLLQFENRLRDITANYVSITDGYLWRRDVTRLVALKLPYEITGHYDYEIREISQKQIKDITVQKDHVVKLKTQDGNETVRPVDATSPATLNYMLQQKEEVCVQVELERKRMKEIMLILEQKCGTSKNTDPKIIFNFEGNEIFIKDRNEVFEIPIVKTTKNNQGIYAYSFYLLKDMIYNNYKENIFFSIFEKYVKLDFPDEAWGVLMGCHINVDELFESGEETFQTSES
ncbi:hypothetical protein CN918_27350 [Priestia megaterium]|nr:hypothetical protein CN918_27350 [Priestia megaterium]